MDHGILFVGMWDTSTVHVPTGMCTLYHTLFQLLLYQSQGCSVGKFISFFMAKIYVLFLKYAFQKVQLCSPNHNGNSGSSSNNSSSNNSLPILKRLQRLSAPSPTLARKAAAASNGRCHDRRQFEDEITVIDKEDVGRGGGGRLNGAQVRLVSYHSKKGHCGIMIWGGHICRMY